MSSAASLTSLPACSPPPLPTPRPEGGHLEGLSLLRHALRVAFPGQIAVVSSFGAESAVLLAWAAEIDPATPVLFLDTDRHFPETIAYRDLLLAELGLRNVQDIRPDPAEVAEKDPTGELSGFDPDACCHLRKVVPLAHALGPYRAWVTGRKRYQSATRAALPLIELVDGRIKLNPLADHGAADIEAEFVRRGLPRHPLTSQGYRSIGCAPCTRPTKAGEDPRAGRWSTLSKTECGIHRPGAA
jgi:phosphoadenosine phosphosulfate reductase